jgi:preprotein translocase subunit SecD
MVCQKERKMKIKLTFKIWLLIILVVLSLISIFGLPPSFSEKGVLITSIEPNSTASDQGMVQGEVIVEIDGRVIKDLDDYSLAFENKFLSGDNEKTIIKTRANEYILYDNIAPDIIVAKIPDTNLKLGLDLAGGSRAIVKAENKSLTSKEVGDLVDITSNRLNEFGLTDLKVVPVSDLSGNNFMLIEIAGATPKDLKKLISEQGKFEAKIGNETVFEGGSRDISSVGRDAQNARIEGCDQSQEGYFCRFSFTITLSGDAAKKHAEVTEDLEVNITPQGNYLDKQLDLFLDDKLVSSLLISESLKGRVTTQISISGSGEGATEEEAYDTAQAEMKQLQTVLITGSLPYKLEIIKLDTISPTLGNTFVRSILLAGLAAFVVVSIIIFIRYKRFKASVALLLTSISEVIIILGIASLISWNLDLPSLAGILATIGTGIDDLIILIDESKNNMLISLKQRLKRAFAIIMGAYFTSLVSLLPLLWAGAGLLKGFAITTIIGISVGVLITRPAFSDMIKRIEK